VDHLTLRITNKNRSDIPHSIRYTSIATTTMTPGVGPRPHKLVAQWRRVKLLKTNRGEVAEWPNAVVC
jgi:hypothetical protein